MVFVNGYVRATLEACGEAPMTAVQSAVDDEQSLRDEERVDPSFRAGEYQL